nr:hypothetical protein [Candidatus Sigynarchaeota archaeon]
MAEHPRYPIKIKTKVSISLSIIALVFCSTALLSDIKVPDSHGFNDLVQKSDLPSTYSSTFTGSFPSYDSMIMSFTNGTKNQTLVLKNGFKNNPRYALLSLTNSTFAISGYEIYKVEAKITNNVTTATNDWVNVNTNDDTVNQTIYKVGSGNLIDMLGQQMTQNWRVQILNLSLYLRIGTGSPGLVPAPRLELWNATAAPLPSRVQWS